MKKSILSICLTAIALYGCQDDHLASFDDNNVNKHLLTEGGEVRKISEEARKNLILGEAYIKLSEETNIQPMLSRSGGGPIPMSAFPSPLSTTLGHVKGVKVTPVFDVSGEFAERKRKAGLHRWMKVTFDEDVDVYEVVDRLSRTKGVTVAHESYKIKMADHRFVPASKSQRLDSNTPSDYNDGYPAFTNADPYLKKQWHYENKGDGGDFVEDADINLFNAWKKETGKKEVIVAVIDGGVAYEHEDLKDNMWINPNITATAGKHGYNFADKKPEIEPTPHGTHVAGTVAARNNNSLGGCGIAGGNGTPDSGVRIMSCQIFGKIFLPEGKSRSADAEGIAKAFEFAADNGAVIAQNSWGWSYDTYVNGLTKLQDVIQAAIDYFIQYAGTDKQGNLRQGSLMKGGVVLFAAGNDGKNFPALPGVYDATIAVSSMETGFKKASYSNYGGWLDIMAPGGSIDKVHHAGVLSTVPSFFKDMRLTPEGHFPVLYGRDFLVDGNENYAYMQGTSMACPHVSGIAALIVSKFGGANFTNEDLKKRLLTALKYQDINKNNPDYQYMLGKGYIDASVALEENKGTSPTKATNVTAVPQYTEVDLTWLASADEDAAYGTAFSYTIYRSEETIDKTKLATYPKVEASDLSKKAGEKITYKVGDLKENTQYYFAIEAKDRWGNKADVALIEIKTKENTAPTIENAPATPIVVTTETVKLTFVVSDKEGHDWSVKMDKKLTGVDVVKNGKNIDITVRPIQNEGLHNFFLIITDELGKESRVEIQLQKINYKAPKLVAEFDNVVIGLDESPLQVELSDKFTVSAGFTPAFEVESFNKNVATATLQGTKLVVTPKTVGTTAVKVKVSDGRKSVEASIPVRVVKKGNAGVYAIYPVPVRSRLSALTHSTVDKVTFIVSNVRGAEVFRATVASDKKTHVATVDLKKLVPGTYHLTILSNKEKYQSMFVKN